MFPVALWSPALRGIWTTSTYCVNWTSRTDYATHILQKKAPLEKGNTGGRSLKHCVLHATGNSTSVNTEVPRSASTSHPIASSTVHLQHIHLRFPILSFQVFFPNSCCLICYIIKFCCSGKCTARCLLSWININAKTNSAGTLPLPWSHLSW